MAVFANAAGKPQVEAEFPFDLRDGFIWLKVTVKESPAPLNFILDSGAAVSTLNSATARNLGLSDGRQVRVKGVGAETVGYWPQRIRASAGDVRLPASYLVVDLCALEQACACPVDGLIGADFFDERIVQIDFDDRLVRLLAKNTKVPGTTIPLTKSRGGVRCVTVSVNGQTVKNVRLDTGCAAGLRWVSKTVPSSSSEKVHSIGLAEFSASAVQSTVRVGSVTFEAVPTVVHDTPIFRGESGLLGNGVLSRFRRVTLDGKANRLVLD